MKNIQIQACIHLIQRLSVQDNENIEELKFSFPSIDKRSKGNSFLDYFNTIEVPSKPNEKNINFEVEDEKLLQPEEISINRISKFAIVSNNSSPTLVKDTSPYNSPLKIQKTRYFKGFDSNQDQFIKMIVTNIVDEIVLFEGRDRREDKIKRMIESEKLILNLEMKIREGTIFKNEINENVGRFGWLKKIDFA